MDDRGITMWICLLSLSGAVKNAYSDKIYAWIFYHHKKFKVKTFPTLIQASSTGNCSLSTLGNCERINPWGPSNDEWCLAWGSHSPGCRWAGIIVSLFIQYYMAHFSFWLKRISRSSKENVPSHPFGHHWYNVFLLLKLILKIMEMYLILSWPWSMNGVWPSWGQSPGR